MGDEFDADTGLPRQVTVAGLDLAMRLVPAGEFDLGGDHLANARPVHTVRVEAFYLGQFELTQAQWRSVTGNNPSVHQGAEFADAPRMPVENVSWADCQALVREINARVPGGGFRLPSEAEWEYACRNGSAMPSPLADWSRRAWFRENSLRRKLAPEALVQADSFAPRSVGTREANRWGFHDMQGNVAEWCSSLYRPYLYHATDGRESLDADGLRVVRGGSFADSAELHDPALRHSDRPERRHRWTGLRLARSVPKRER